MIVIGGMLLGALMGALTAKRRNGKAVDMAQYAVGFGVACGLATWIVLIILDRLLA
jgi:hypothetical protein